MNYLLVWPLIQNYFSPTFVCFCTEYVANVNVVVVINWKLLHGSLFFLLTQDSYGDTPLHDAVAKDFRNIIEILVVVPNIDFTQQNHRGFNLLHHAALKGNKLWVEKKIFTFKNILLGWIWSKQWLKRIIDILQTFDWYWYFV